jgi:RHS repeat-associated protein
MGEIENACGWQCRQAVRTRLCGGISADLIFCFFLIKQKEEEENMNGRLYDPVIGRFFSPDTYVQNPGFTQSFNRYSYALNNPLKYLDPTGQWYGDVDDYRDYYDRDPTVLNEVETVTDRSFYDPFGNLFGIDYGISDDLWGDFGGGDKSPKSKKIVVRQGYNLPRIGSSIGYSLKDKLNWIVENNRTALNASAGNADVTVLVGTRSNVNEYGNGHTYEWGNIFNKDREPVNAFSVNSDNFNVTNSGIKQYLNNKIIVEKNTIRLMWGGSETALETLFHEWRHCYYFTSGIADNTVRLYGKEQAEILMEVWAHQFSYYRFRTEERREIIQDYKNRLDLGIKLMFGY